MDNNIEFVWNQIQGLRDETKEIDYDVDLEFTQNEIRNLVQNNENEDEMESGGGGVVEVMPQENERPIERLIPDYQVPKFNPNLQIPDLDGLLGW